MLWRSYVQTLFWLFGSLCVLTPWSKLPHAFKQALLSQFRLIPWIFYPAVWRVLLSSWSLTQCRLTFNSCCGFFLTWVSWAKWILHNLSYVLMQLLPLCSKNVFFLFDYFVTQAYHYGDILLTSHVSLTFWCAVQSSKPIWCSEAVVVWGAKVYL
jgi:hypothetical protein